MGYSKIKKIADTAVRLTAGYLGEASKSASKSKNFSKDQQADFSAYADKMGEIKANGIQGLLDCFSCSDDDYIEEIETDFYSNEEGNDNCEMSFITSEPQSDITTNEITLPSKNKTKYKEKKTPPTEKEINKKILASIKEEKEFLMMIEKVEYVEKKSGKGYVLSGMIKKGGIYQKEKSKVVIKYQDGSTSVHQLISVLCNSQHKKYNYAKKGQYVRLFVNAEETMDLSVAVSVCEFIHK